MHNFKIKYIKTKIIEMNEEDSTIKKPRRKKSESVNMTKGSKNDSSYYDIGLIGSPVYEIIAESHNTDTWYVEIDVGSLNGENNITININTKPYEGQNAGDITVVTYVGLEMEKM